ncbi:MAG: dihydroorotate dehydrogenase-like protein [Bacteroidales bacterium]|jgi:dihydroorotate dehydrogenase (fumarate)|nr:dihydroorotate dehydrogenase-like protein [Bacteroidales bacterium]
MKLNTSYLGLQLKNPLIVGSSSLTDSVEKIQKLEAAGAAAVVLKSLFEEQILHEAHSLQNAGDYYPEAADYLHSYVQGHSVQKYLQLIEDAKGTVSIPIIASVNCMSATGWIDFAKKMEMAGADALEVNMYFIPTNKDRQPIVYEEIYFEIAAALKQILKIPFSFKLGNHFTSLPNLVDHLYNRGTKGVVLFNRFYEPDIDIKTLGLKSASVYSTSADLRNSLRWISIVSSIVENIEISASTGIHDASGVIKTILAGAQTTQLCSAIYNNGPDLIQSIISDLEKWMEEHHFDSIEGFRGKSNYRNIDNPQQYERSQFMKYFSSHI